MSAARNVAGVTVAVAVVLGWAWRTERSQRIALERAATADMASFAQQRFDNEALWLVPLADGAVRRAPPSGALDATPPANDAAIAAWLAAAPPPEGFACAPPPVHGGPVDLVPELVDKEPWRSLGLPALGADPMHVPPSVLGQFRYARAGTRAFVAFVGDPRGSGETQVRWIEITRSEDGTGKRTPVRRAVLPRP